MRAYWQSAQGLSIALCSPLVLQQKHLWSSACCVCQSGEWREDMTAKIPTADAPPELHEGVEVQLSNGLQATVAEVTDDHVVIDANHALAGKDLNFEVELIKLQKVFCHAAHATNIQNINVLVCAYCMVMCSVACHNSFKHLIASGCVLLKGTSCKAE